MNSSLHQGFLTEGECPVQWTSSLRLVVLYRRKIWFKCEKQLNLYQRIPHLKRKFTTVDKKGCFVLEIFFSVKNSSTKLKP
jgi:hypothetical protein